jgi:hypothetical protein
MFRSGDDHRIGHVLLRDSLVLVISPRPSSVRPTVRR